MKRITTIVKDINKLFPRDCGHPVCFVRSGEELPTVSAEACCGRHEDAADYYSERGWLINPKLEKYLQENSLWAEWENPGCLTIYRD